MGKKKPDTASIFLSYAREDFDQVIEFYHRLQGAGYAPWIDKRDLLPGDRWRDAIRRAVKNCDFFLAFLSQHSVDRRGVIQREIRWALDQSDEMLDKDIYLIPVRLDDIEIPERLGEIQWVDLFDDDGWSRLMNALEARGFPGVDKPPTPTKDRWSVVRQIRQPIMDLVTPTYLLDKTYHLLDWNAAFDEVVAKQTGLRRGEHGLEFIRQMTNCREVIERSKQIFGQGKDPLVDIEILHLDTQDYGTVLFQKIAARISDDHDNPLAWCVNLNILVAERLRKLWDDLQRRLEYEVNWLRYSVSYDKLLTQFDDYNHLLDLVVGMVGDAQRCIDLGAGTGNGTKRLLESDPHREVWALEPNEGMLRYLRSKVEKLNLDDSTVSSDFNWQMLDHLDRLTIVKEDVLRMDELPANHFDAAIMINVLYAVEDPQLCLRQIHRILRSGGELVFSTAHQGTDVERLFNQMQQVLEEKQLFEGLKSNFEGAKRAHKKMNANIHRDSLADIRRYVEDAGFVIPDASRDWREGEYVGSVVVVRARKQGD